MSKYAIHACPARMWYVEQYLVPSLIAQGIDSRSIMVKCDDKGLGNLKSCMDIFSHITQPGGTWHLQDDVIICRDFKERTESQEPYEIVCGFVIPKDENLKNVGYVKPNQMWWSFPCIYIPNDLARESVHWINDVARYKSIYNWMLLENKYDDSLFREFLTVCYPDYNVLNLKPCLVDHIDYLIGGTTINAQRTNKDVRAAWFDDTDLVDELAEKLANEQPNE